ncbi:amino acid adenylation domain-containing protein (plasmid) [Kitasatospora sp. NBC_00070]|uniref:amino acid adenylation domain-containing protein n=1 Tax=Kitasatospora sp. NBC_00070 TaxID=2975962 RepID=UPI0032543360
MEHPEYAPGPAPRPLRVLSNGDGFQALWPDALPLPAGWDPVGAPGSREECLLAVARSGPALRPSNGAPGVTVHGLFRRRAARTPDATAVIGDEERLTYRELDRRSDRLAQRLRAHGVRADSVVPVCLRRDAAMVVSLLAVLKAGAAFLPLDPGYPTPRLRQAAEGSRAALAITSADEQDRLGLPALTPERSAPDTVAPAETSRPDDLAYLIYTTGTTGTPKGVAVSHRTMLVTIVRAARAYRLSGSDRVLQLAALGFDTSLEQIFAPLLSGATVVLGGRRTWSPAEFLHEARRTRVTVADLTPSYWHQALALLTDGARAPEDLRLLIVGGETVHAEDGRASLRHFPSTAHANAYGLTETGITSTLGRFRPQQLDGVQHSVAVGRPLPGSTVHILDPLLQPVPPGRRGEVFVGGHGLALGYWHDPALTAERFLPDPYAHAPGTRMYRTGDLGFWRPDGQLELIGRIDDQVKIRGHRVDPAEIEGHLRSHPAVGQAVVLAGKDRAGTAALTAYYTPAPGADPHPGLRDHLAARLPEHLVPASFHALSQLPLDINGKIDRRRLAQTALAPAGPTRAGADPLAEADHGLAYLWTQLLGVDSISPDDDFFKLGGDSLTAMDMLARARLMYGLGIEHLRDLTRALLADPTLAAVEAALHEATVPGHHRPQERPADYQDDATLGVPVRRTHTAADPPVHALVTGATGFCGTHLLHTLLSTAEDIQLHCLVRAVDTDHALERLRTAHWSFLGRELDTSRIHPVVGDLTQPLLGLGRRRFEELARTMDAIHHLGGRVNFLYPYRQLRAANVSGTREIIRLAGHSRGIPVHYLSTMAVLAGFGAVGTSDVTEDTPLDHARHLGVGYVESKWTAEALLNNASAAGLPVTIYRVNDVTGDLAGGTMNLGTELCALIRYFDDTGEFPDVDLPLDFVPADRFTQALAHIATHVPARGQVFHLTNPHPAPLAALARRIQARGRTVSHLPYPEWTRRLIAHTTRYPDHPLTPFLPLFVDRAPTIDRTISEMYFRPTFPRFTTDRADRALAASGIEIPPVDDQLLDFYLGRLEALGYLAPST